VIARIRLIASLRAPEPGHRGVNWDAEFDADIDDLLRLIEMAAAEHPQRQA
jgi:hypothetical protein